MRLNEVFSPLRENETYSAVDEAQYEEVIADYFQKKKYLYRGMKKTSPVILGDGNSVKRGSSAALPYINWYTSVSEAWKKFPPRDKSFICTTYVDYARRYGYEHFVIPLESQDMGICPVYDFWASFEKINSIPGLTQMMFDVFYDVSERTPKTPQEMMTLIAEVDKKMLSGEYSPIAEDERPSPYELALSRYKTLTDYLKDCTDPSLNGFKVSKEVPRNNQEVWLTGKVLFIEKQYAVDKGWFNEA